MCLLRLVEKEAGDFHLPGVLIPMPSKKITPHTDRDRLPPDQASVVRTNPPFNMSMKEGAAYLGICTRKMRWIVAHNRVPHSRLGRTIILRREALDQLATNGASY